MRADPAAEVAAPPVEVVPDDLDGELLDLLCDDAAWLDAAFEDIVATSWSEPPRRGRGRHAGGPRRHGRPRQRHSRRAASGRGQFAVRPSGRQRSPPR